MLINVKTQMKIMMINDFAEYDEERLWRILSSSGEPVHEWSSIHAPYSIRLEDNYGGWLPP
jgi:hypothetical protein